MNATKQQPPLGIRLPQELKTWIKDAALSNRRSVNGEVIVRLEESRRRDELAKQTQQ